MCVHMNAMNRHCQFTCSRRKNLTSFYECIGITLSRSMGREGMIIKGKIDSMGNKASCIDLFRSDEILSVFDIC